MSIRSTRRIRRGAASFVVGAAVSAALFRLLGSGPPSIVHPVPPSAPLVSPDAPLPFAPGTVLSRFKDGGLDQKLAARDIGAPVTEAINADTHDVTIRFDTSIPVGNAVKALRRDPQVVFAEPDGFCEADYTPDDPMLNDQWHLKTIHAPEAWDTLRKVNSNVRLAIIDTGIDYTHPDLERIMARDSKGDLVGKSFVPNTTGPLDDHGHGTHCAGIAAADTDNGVGVAGVGFRSFKLVPVKVLSASGSGGWDAVANGITWAADNGCRVESMSLGGYFYSQGIQDAVDYAWSKGVIVVAAAGNSSSPSPGSPADCNHVMAISATDSKDRLASFSNYGRPIAVGAPGVNILATMPTYDCTMTRGGRCKKNYDYLSGTSMACPVTAGMVAALLAYQPSLKPEEAIQRIEQTTDNTAGAPDGGWEAQFGHGRVNLANAIAGRARKSSLGCFYGQIVNRNAVAVPNATVRCGSVSVTTGPDGMFRLANLKTGSHTLSVTSSSGTGTKTASIVPGADVNVTITVSSG